ncbi:MAG: hypothetical protein ABIO24_11525, partial [Saprospiraceae bacterium]
NEFAFASRSSLGVDAAQRLPGDSLKYRRAVRIYNKLVAARGDYRYAIPDFVMTRDEQKVAWMNFDRLEVGIEEKAYDVCMTFGPDADAALAQLLGHELSHYYEKHNWRRDFARQFKDLAVGAQLGVMTQADSVFNETQADYLGGFLAYSAGFPVFDQGAALTGALYQAYQLPDALRIYPVLAERKKLNERSAQLLDKLVNVYEMANLLTATGHYQQAALYYQHVLQDYQSPAVYNNAGVMTTLAALSLGGDTTAYTFVLPIELDITSLSGKGANAVEARHNLLREALHHFDAAIALDPDYAPAYLNKACALVLLSDKTRAAYYAGVEVPAAVGRQPTYKKTAVDARVVLGILQIMQGDSAKADAVFQAVYNQDSSAVARENLLRLRAKKVTPAAMSQPALSLIPETIDGLDLYLSKDELAVDYDGRLQLGAGLTFYQNLRPGPHSKLLVSEEKSLDGLKKMAFLLTDADYRGETARKIKIGSPAAAVLKAYKSPDEKLETTRGQLWRYNDIIFFLGPDLGDRAG